MPSSRASRFLFCFSRVLFPGLQRLFFAGPGGGAPCSASGSADASTSFPGGITGRASKTVVAKASPPTSIDSAGPSTGDVINDVLGFGTGFCVGVDDFLLCVSKQGTILTNLGLWPKASSASRVPGPRSADTATLQRTFSEKVLTTS